MANSPSGGGTTQRRKPSKDAAGMDSSPLVHELTRLRNELHVKANEIQEKAVEITTLQRQLKVAEQGAQRAEQQLEATRDRLLSTQKEAESARRLLTATQAERDELRREAEATARGAMKALDKESQVMQDKVMAAQGAVVRAKDLESEVVALRRQLAAAQEDAAMLQRQQRAAQEELVETQQLMQKQGRELATTSEYLAGVMSDLAATQDSLQIVRRENKALLEQVAQATAGGYIGSTGNPGVSPAAPTKPGARAGAAPAPAADSGTAAASTQAALQQAMQQLSLRTQEVTELKKQLQAAQSAALTAGPSSVGNTTAPISAGAARAAAYGGSGPATPDVEGIEAAGTADSAQAAVASGRADVEAADAPTTSGAAPAAGAATEQGHSISPDGAGSSGDGAVAVAAASAAPALPSDATAAVVPVPRLPPVAVQPPAASAAAVDATGAPLPRDLPQAHSQIISLQEQVARLRQHLHNAAAAGQQSEDEEEGSSDEEGDSRRAHSSRQSTATSPTSAGAALPAVALSPAQQAAEERRRNAQRGQLGTLWFGGQRQYNTEESGGLTKESLADMIDKLVQSREEQNRRPRGSKASGVRVCATRSGSTPRGGDGPGSEDGSGGAGGRDDSALWEEATAMLRGELIRLGQETARKMEENERLRTEVGELKSARLSAEATAVRLEEMNALSIRVASLKLELAALKSEQDIREDELLAQIAMLQQQLAKKKKKRSATRMLKKTWSQAVDSFKHGLQGHSAGTPEGPTAAATTSPHAALAPAANSAERSQPSPRVSGGGGEGRRSWSGFKSKLGSLGGRSSSSKGDELAAVLAATTPRN